MCGRSYTTHAKQDLGIKEEPWVKYTLQRQSPVVSPNNASVFHFQTVHLNKGSINGLNCSLGQSPRDSTYLEKLSQIQPEV